MKHLTALFLLSAMSGTVSAQAVNVAVPSDSKASYQIFVKPMNGALLVISKRSGPGGVSFSAREVHCNTMKFRYLAEGDTMDVMMRNIRDTDPMSGLTNGSISYYIAHAACKQ